MSEALWGLPAALWLGLLTSISPCPLATNIAAVSYIGRRLDSPRRVLAAGLLYTAGRMAAYAALGALIVASLLSIPGTARALQTVMNKALGPLLLLVGAVMLGWLRPAGGGGGAGARLGAWAAARGSWGAPALGAVFALTFCPVSAALYFGSLIPLALRQGSPLALPLVYGLGTGLPVVVFAVLVAGGARSLAAAFDRVGRIERWARPLTGVVFLGVGLYYCLTYLAGVNW